MSALLVSPSTAIIITPKTQCPNPQFHLSLFSNPLSLSLQLKTTQRKLPSSIKCQYFDFEQQKQRKPITITDSPSTEVSRSRPKLFVGHSIYKGKAALTVEPRAPEFLAMDSGAYKISREGYVLLQFAPAVGARNYDWSRKQVFSLSVTEIGSMIDLGPNKSCEFFHDPNKGKSDEGKVRKVLKVDPLPDGTGYSFKLSVQNKLINVDESIYIPISRAEFAVLVSAFNFLLPYFLGWHAFVDSVKPEDNTRGNNANARNGADYEWNR
ncbi:hypothetical protein ACFE04_023241 [Oxalis oulophora]